MKQTFKLESAHALINGNQDLKRMFPQLKNMLHVTLYARLEALGYAWDTHYWALVTPQVKEDASVTMFSLKNRVQIRVMCDESLVEGTVEELVMLLDLIDARVLKVSPPKKNAHGTWVRVYIDAAIER